MKKNIIPIIFTVCLFACSSEDFLQYEDGEQFYKEGRHVLTRSSVSEEDFIHFIQTDKISMILNRIVPTDSVYILDLSREQAHILEIPDSIYDLAIDIVNQYNNPSK
jgi:hypothetical protein